MSEVHDRLKAIGPFGGVIQLVPTVSDAHELLTHPADPSAGPVGVLTYHGGRTITAAKVQVVFMDGYADDKADFTAFARAVVENGYYGSPDGSDKSNGVFLGAVNATSGLPASVKDSQLQAWIDANVGTVLAPSDPNTIYMLMMGPGTTVTIDSGGSSCSDYCGYHSKTAGGHYYAIQCDPACTGCHGSFTPAQGREMVFSHEYGEWRSDPDGTGWYSDQTGAENGDECAWQLVAWGPNKQWAVQPLAAQINGAWTCQTLPYVASQPTPSPQPQPQPKPQADCRTPAMAITLAAYNQMIADYGARRITYAQAQASYGYLMQVYNGDLGLQGPAGTTPAAFPPEPVEVRA